MTDTIAREHKVDDTIISAVKNGRPAEASPPVDVRHHDDSRMMHR